MMFKLGKNFVRGFALVVVLSVGLAGSPCLAALYSGDIWNGSLSVVGGGITQSGWPDLTISWLITPVTDGDSDPDIDWYHYQYTFSTPTGGDVSHFILEISPNFNELGLDELGFLNDSLTPEGIQGYLAGGDGYYYPSGGNPGMPAGGLHGIKFDNDQDSLTSPVFGETDPLVWSFDSWREPVWGDFYAKDGIDTYAFNTGFGMDPSLVSHDLYGFIATVDTTIVPVPAAVILGLLGMGVVGLKLRKFA